MVLHMRAGPTHYFVHDGKRYVLKLMIESAIKIDEISAKKRTLKNIPKLRTALFRGGGDGMDLKTINTSTDVNSFLVEEVLISAEREVRVASWGRWMEPRCRWSLAFDL